MPKKRLRWLTRVPKKKKLKKKPKKRKNEHSIPQNHYKCFHIIK